MSEDPVTTDRSDTIQATASLQCAHDMCSYSAATPAEVSCLHLCHDLRTLRARAAQAAHASAHVAELQAQLHALEHSLGRCLLELPCMRDADAVGLYGSESPEDAVALAALPSLTPAERRVLRQLAVARTSRAVSEALYVSVRTVEKHRGNIVRKLGLRGTNALLSFAVAYAEQIDRLETGG